MGHVVADALDECERAIFLPDFAGLAGVRLIGIDLSRDTGTTKPSTYDMGPLFFDCDRRTIRRTETRHRLLKKAVTRKSLATWRGVGLLRH